MCGQAAVTPNPEPHTAKAGRKLGANAQLAIASGVAVVIVLTLAVVGIEKDRQAAVINELVDDPKTNRADHANNQNPDQG
jgi:acid phosphatase family membrane protein YuiD